VNFKGFSPKNPNRKIFGSFTPFEAKNSPPPTLQPNKPYPTHQATPFADPTTTQTIITLLLLQKVKQQSLQKSKNNLHVVLFFTDPKCLIKSRRHV
jgi:hypothetical protein